MRKDEILNILKELEIPTEEWTELYEIESIMTSSGIGIYPNWKHLRFLFTKDGDLLIKHGKSIPYGARLTLNFSLGMDGKSANLSPIDTVPGTEYYESFRFPKAGDQLLFTNGLSVINEVMIIKVIRAINCTTLQFSAPLNVSVQGKLSFYDPTIRKEGSMHSNPIEGIFMNFSENSGKRHKIYGVFHEIIKSKQITEINLKIRSKYNQKTLKVRGGSSYGSK